MKKYSIALATLLSFLTVSSNAQINFNNQVLVYFKSGAQREGPANTSTNITSTNILNVISSYNIPVSNVVPSFPAFIESDTVKAEVGEFKTNEQSKSFYYYYKQP